MPQVPSANMRIIWPTDGDDADAWAPIMDQAVRVVIDGHTHAPGSGAQISMSSLKVDADISWSAGGVARAIKDIRALDFSPQPASGMALLAGALFLSDGTGGLVSGELYYRTVSGANVQLTNGAALNFAAFVGGIAGDYQAVGAEEKYDDATHAYWFRQQVGAAVRQYAKMRSADLSLFEFKAVGTSPVPGFAVTLKSPAALAADYALTLPGGLPAQTEGLSVDTTGAITAGSKHGTRTLSIHGSLFQPIGGVNGTTNPNPAYNFSLGLSGAAANTPGNTITLNVVAPVMLPVGSRILAVRFYVSDSATGPTKVTCQISSASGTTGTSPGALASAGPSAGTGFQQTLTIPALTLSVTSGSCYFLTVLTTSGGAQAAVTMAEIDYDRP